MQGNWAEPRSYYETSLSHWRGLGDPRRIIHTLDRLGLLAINQRQYADARRFLAEAVDLARRLPHPVGLVESVEACIVLAAKDDQEYRAVILAGAADAIRGRMSAPPPSSYGRDLNRLLEPIRDRLGEPASEAAWREGKAMPLEQAVDYALEALGPPPFSEQTAD